MASDNKINCTRLPNEQFTIRVAYFQNSPPEEIASLKKAVEDISGRLPDVRIQYAEWTTDKPSVANEIAELSADPVQINLLLFDADKTNWLGEYTYACNNHFHNMPNLLVGAIDKENAAALVKKFPSFDLFISNTDYDSLNKLIAAIRGRTYDDQPIPLDVYPNLSLKGKSKT